MADPSQSWGGAGGLAGGPTGGMVQKLVVAAGGMALAYQTGWLPALLRYSAVGSAMMLGVIFTQQSSMLYQNNVPQLPKSPRDPRLPPEMRLSPDARGLPFEDLRDSQLLSAIDGEPPVRLHGWLLLQPLPLRERAPTLIYSHGNAGNIAFRMDDLERQYRTLGANILIYERIREELRLGKNSRAAADAGFDKALWAVLDANIYPVSLANRGSNARTSPKAITEAKPCPDN